MMDCSIGMKPAEVGTVVVAKVNSVVVVVTVVVKVRLGLTYLVTTFRTVLVFVHSVLFVV